MYDTVTLKARADVWLPTYSPGSSAAEGALQLAEGKTYTLDVYGKGFLNISNYALDELLVTTKDVAAALGLGSLEVISEDEKHIVRGYN